MAPSNANSLPVGGSSNDAMARSAIAEYDRRNRSFPHPKYGPYTCPRCKGLFRTSQTFAAHMRSHYRSENEEERRIRLEEKHRCCGNRRGPVRAAAGPMLMAFQPIRLSRQTLNALARNVPMPVKTENVKVREMEDVQGIGSALGLREVKQEPVM